MIIMIIIDALFQGLSIAVQPSTAPALSLPNAKPSLSGNSTKDLDLDRFIFLDCFMSFFMQIDIFGSW